jgi:hypothetical protein
VKLEPGAGVAVSVTGGAVGAKAAEHVVPQSISPPPLVTVPAPVPARLTVSVGPLNFAVTLVAALTVTTHVPRPQQSPPVQPAKVDPLAAAAVSVTRVLGARVLVQVAPQLIPGGPLVTVPDPTSFLVTVREGPLKVAVTVVAAVRVT